MRAMVLRGVLGRVVSTLPDVGPRRQLLVERHHVAAEHRMVGAHLVVDLAIDLSLVVLLGAET